MTLITERSEPQDDAEILSYLEIAIAHLGNAVEIVEKMNANQKVEPDTPLEIKPTPELRPKRTIQHNKKIKFTAEEMAFIKYRKGFSPRENKKLAERFNVSFVTIWQIQSGYFQTNSPQIADWIIDNARKSANKIES